MTKSIIVSSVITLLFINMVSAQSVDFKYFGDISNNTLLMEEDLNNEMLIGDHAIFFRTNLNDDFSFLGELTLGQKNSEEYQITAERVLIKFKINKQFVGYAGKMHIPINYWNDVYHHGKLFFPTIDRPEFFKFFIPIHSIGLRLQNQNIGKLKFGYDIVLGDGISNDTQKYSIGKSVTASLHLKPTPKSRYTIGFYYDTIKPDIISSHSGLRNRFHNAAVVNAVGNINYTLLTASLAHFGKKVEFLGEFIANRTGDEADVKSWNGGMYLYNGYKLNEQTTLFSQFDQILVSSTDVFTTPLDLNKISAGFKYEFDYRINLKAQSGTCSISHKIPGISNERAYFIKIQLSYGF